MTDPSAEPAAERSRSLPPEPHSAQLSPAPLSNSQPSSAHPSPASPRDTSVAQPEASTVSESHGSQDSRQPAVPAARPELAANASPGATYLACCHEILHTVAQQLPAIEQAASWFADTILAGRMVHLFGSGHSRIMVEEMWPRYGSFPGFNPIVELSLSFHNLVVGANGQRQAMFIENVSGLAERILRNFDIATTDCALVISSSGCNTVPIEMAREFQRRGVKVVGLISAQHSAATTTRSPDGKKLGDYCDLVLDTGAPVGDAMVRVPGLDTPVAPGSTVGGCLIINALKAETAARLTAAGQPPRVLTSSAVVGRERAEALFESAYDEHAHRLARLYAQVHGER